MLSYNVDDKVLKKVNVLDSNHTERAKTELTNELARIVKTELSYLFEII